MQGLKSPKTGTSSSFTLIESSSLEAEPSRASRVGSAQPRLCRGTDAAENSPTPAASSPYVVLYMSQLMQRQGQALSHMALHMGTATFSCSRLQNPPNASSATLEQLSPQHLAPAWPSDPAPRQGLHKNEQARPQTRCQTPFPTDGPTSCSRSQPR